MSEESVHVQLKQKRDFQFDIHFDAEIHVVMGDEPPPPGVRLK